MLFNSWPFLGLVLVTLAVYYAPFMKRLQPLVLILASFVFYAHHSPFLLMLLVASIAINAFSSHRVMAPDASLAGARRWAIAGVVGNLSILGFFKYSGMLAETFVTASGGGPGQHEWASWLVGLPLPLGISFFTFQGMSLVIDAYRSRDREQLRKQLGQTPEDPLADSWASGLRHHRAVARHWLHTTLFIAFFPQLVAGPIVKAREFLPQVGQKLWRNVDLERCLRALVTGYFLKMVVADNLNQETVWIAWPYFESLHSLQLFAMLFGYSMQIFADFAGYSLIAIGIAGLFGYSLPRNFNAPYIAQSFSDFWRRWHISLSSWLRDYLYIPLGGSRRGGADGAGGFVSRRTLLNVMIVMTLGGLWHGAAWSYAVWGSCHGIALVIERLLQRRSAPAPSALGAVLRGTLVFSFVTAAWLLFKLPDFSQALLYFRAMAVNWGGALELRPLFAIAFFSLPVVLIHLRALFPDSMKASERWLQASVPARSTSAASGAHWRAAAVYGAMLFFLLFDAGPPGAFIYFQF